MLKLVSECFETVAIVGNLWCSSRVNNDAFQSVVQSESDLFKELPNVKFIRRPTWNLIQLQRGRSEPSRRYEERSKGFLNLISECQLFYHVFDLSNWFHWGFGNSNGNENILEYTRKLNIPIYGTSTQKVRLLWLSVLSVSKGTGSIWKIMTISFRSKSHFEPQEIITCNVWRFSLTPVGLWSSFPFPTISFNTTCKFSLVHFAMK